MKDYTEGVYTDPDGDVWVKTPVGWFMAKNAIVTDEEAEARFGPFDLTDNV